MILTVIILRKYLVCEGLCFGRWYKYVWPSNPSTGNRKTGHSALSDFTFLFFQIALWFCQSLLVVKALSHHGVNKLCTRVIVRSLKNGCILRRYVLWHLCPPFFKPSSQLRNKNGGIFNLWSTNTSTLKNVIQWGIKNSTKLLSKFENSAWNGFTFAIRFIEDLVTSGRF